MTQPYVIPRSDMCMSDPMPFSQHWEARVPVPLEEIEDMGAALQMACASMRPGDLVFVCSFEDKNWHVLTGTQAFRILSVAERRVHAATVSEITRFGNVKPLVNAPAPTKLHIAQVGNSFEVRDDKENPLEIFISKEQAESYIRNQPKADPTAEVTDFSGYELKRGIAGKWIVKDAKGGLVREFPRKTDAEQWMAKQAPKAAQDT